MKQIILHNLDSKRTYHIFPPFSGDGMYQLIIGSKLRPDHNIEVAFNTQEELDALLLAYKARGDDES